MTEVYDYGPAEPQEFFFRYGGQNYVLAEARGRAVVEYRDSINKQVRATGRTVTSDGAARFEPVLLARCVYSLQEGGGRLAVTADWCRDLPGHVFRDLFDRLERMSGLAQAGDTLAERLDALEARVVALEAGGAAHANGEAPEGNLLAASTPGGS